MKQVEELFEQYTGRKPESVNELPSSGSNRRYFRLKAGDISLIVAKGLKILEKKVCLCRRFMR